MYKFKDNNTMVTNRYKVILRDKKGYIHVTCICKGETSTSWKWISRSGLSSISSTVNNFERKVIMLHFFKQFSESGVGFEKYHISHTNYAEIFGAIYE